MRDADRPTGIPGKSPPARPWGDGRQPEADGEAGFPADDEPEDPDILLGENHGPARGMVVALVPALLIWGLLIALVRKLW